MTEKMAKDLHYLCLCLWHLNHIHTLAQPLSWHMVLPYSSSTQTLFATHQIAIHQ